MIGTEIDGRYRLEAVLGEGGVGTVYRAVHAGLGRTVAVKVLRPEFGASPELRRRFEREARALAALSHPNIVGILDSGVSGDTPYLVMDFLEGETLAARLMRGPLPLEEATDIMRQVLLALAFVHGRGLVHRDVKPGNVFLCKAGEGASVRLLDFGLAKFVAPESGDRALTRVGQVFGTPAYMAPEQVAGQEADPRTDLYAAGIVLFEMLAGAPPFKGDSSEILRQQVMEDLPLEALPSSVPTALVDVLRKAAAKTRAERFSSAEEALVALDAAIAGQRVPGLGTDSGPGGGKEGSRFGRLLGRVGTAVAVTISATALVGAAAFIYVLVSPGHGKERQAIEGALGLPASAERSARPVPSASSHAPPAPVPAASFKTQEASVPPAKEAPAPPSPPGAPRGPVPDPFLSTPRELARFVAKVNRGRYLDKREIVSVHQYNAKHPSDARGHAVLARSYLRRKWFKDVLSEYAIAYKLDPAIRGDPRMLLDLLVLVEAASSEAARFITEVYGADAVPVIDKELGKKTLKPDQRGRVERLRSEISGK